MEQTILDTLYDAREKAHRQICDPRERAIVVRYIEDAICRLVGATSLPALPQPSKQ